MNFTTRIFYFLVSIFIIFNIINLFNFAKEPYDQQTEPIKTYQQQFNDNYKVFAVPLPSDLSFAGEDVPLEKFDVREALDREFLINTYWQSQALLFIKRANRSFPVIEPILEAYNVPDDFKYLAVIESGLIDVVSPVGATGVWQFLKGSAKEYGLEVNSEVDERYNLAKSTEAACKYFLESYKKFNSWTLAAASYNVGRGGISKQMKRQKQSTFYDLLLNRETSRYIYRTLAIKCILENPEKYGFYYRETDLYPKLPCHTVSIDTAVTHWADFAEKFNTNYKVLKYFNPWLRQKDLKNKNRKLYHIILPKSGTRTVYKSIIAKSQQKEKDIENQIEQFEKSQIELKKEKVEENPTLVPEQQSEKQTDKKNRKKRRRNRKDD